MLVLDEPTASLDANETALLFQIVRDLKARGIAIVFITHFIDQVYRDRRPHLGAAQRPAGRRRRRPRELPPLKLISLMLGRELERDRGARSAASRHGAERRADPASPRDSAGGASWSRST